MGIPGLKGYKNGKVVFDEHGLRIVVEHRRPKTKRGRKEEVWIRMESVPGEPVRWAQTTVLGWHRKADILFERPVTL